MNRFLFIFAIPLLLACGNTKTDGSESYESIAPAFCADSSYKYVAEQCSFGPRVMNSAAHDSCGNYIADKFASFGAVVTNQYADSKLYDGTPVKMRNIVASYNADADWRIIICGHWDSRPWADNDDDESKHHTPIDGANDGGSCVGVMLELARQLQLDEAAKGDSALFKMNPNLGIDFICWDAEDCGIPQFAKNETDGDNSDTWCLGSQYWSSNQHVAGYVASYGINLDMVGNANTVFYKEAFSMQAAPNIVDKVWAAAQRIGYGTYFLSENGGGVTDDHLQVNKCGIPCIDVIGSEKNTYSFPTTWHTMDDDIHHISKETLKAVGQTMMEVLWVSPL